MNKYFIFLIACVISFKNSEAQLDSAQKNKEMVGIYERIMKEMQSYVPDTSQAPDDKITRKIIELRNLRGGFNINEAVAFKLQEDAKNNKDISKEDLQKLTDQFQSGAGRRWLDNAVIWIYRKQFTHKELKQLVKFYKTSGGQKMAQEFPFIMLKSMAAAQKVHNLILGEKK